MTEEQNENLDEAVDAPAEAETAEAPTTAEAADGSAEVETEATEVAAPEKPKRTRAAAKPKAEKAEAIEQAEEKPAKAEPKAKADKAEPKAKPRAVKPEQPIAAPVVRAQAKYVRSSARKARLVCDNIRGKSVDDARAILAHTPRAVARDWSKLLESAVANAEHNHELIGEDLVIKAVTADEGPTIKRFRPRAQGRATKIRKRTSHLTILLTPKN
jgi:ribosomal protein L22